MKLRPGSIPTTAFLKPYDYLIWFMLLIITLNSVAFAVFSLQWIYDRMNLNQKNINFELSLSSNFGMVQTFGNFSFGKSLWLVWVLLFRAAAKAQQPKSFSARFIVNIWALMCLVFTASYTANLAAFMIIKEEYPDLKSILDARLTNPYAYKPNYRFGTVKSGATAETVFI